MTRPKLSDYHAAGLDAVSRKFPQQSPVGQKHHISIILCSQQMCFALLLGFASDCEEIATSHGFLAITWFSVRKTCLSFDRHVDFYTPSRSFANRK